MEILDETHYFFSDVETTGFDPIRNDIISLCLIVTDREFNRVGMFYETCRPEFNKFYSVEAEKIHGFNRSQLESFQPRRKLAINLLKFLAPFRTPGKFHPYIYHALKYFDFRFTDWMYRKENLQWSFYKMFDERFTQSTITMARNMGYSPNKLNDWADRIGFDLNHHDAQSDTECLVEVYKHLRGKDESRNIF
jgi:DNA polymerase III epsilon subunit-like protein